MSNSIKNALGGPGSAADIKDNAFRIVKDVELP
jgi:hypothetical protein